MSDDYYRGARDGSCGGYESPSDAVNPMYQAGRSSAQLPSLIHGDVQRILREEDEEKARRRRHSTEDEEVDDKEDKPETLEAYLEEARENNEGRTPKESVRRFNNGDIVELGRYYQVTGGPWGCNDCPSRLEYAVVSCRHYASEPGRDAAELKQRAYHQQYYAMPSPRQGTHCEECAFSLVTFDGIGFTDVRKWQTLNQKRLTELQKEADRQARLQRQARIDRGVKIMLVVCIIILVWGIYYASQTKP